MGDTVPDTGFLDTDMEVTDLAMPVMEVTVLDMAMVDTVARDPLMPGTDVDTVMVDTAVDAVMVDTAVDMVVMVDTDTESKHFPTNSPKKPFYTKLCHLYYCRNE